jgi:dTDP-4-dehydrorhamnose reductase
MNVRNVLLAGGAGQVGSELRRRAPTNWRLVAPPHSEFDISDAAQASELVGSARWDAVINAAAFTKVDAAETSVVESWRINALGPAILAEATGRANIPLVHISTDYVFDGKKPDFYLETDSVAPLSVYGASKEAGEQAVRTANPRHVILRTAWVVSPHGSNFLKTMLRLSRDRPTLRVVDDQLGCPTSATDIAAAIATAVDQMIDAPDPATGTFHFVNDGQASWCEFARTIFAFAGARGQPQPDVEAITTADYPTAAKRPANSRLGTAKFRRAFAVDPRPWQVAVEEIVDMLCDHPDGMTSQ